MNTKTTPKDFFLHLGATVTLFAGVIALINLSFSVINYYLPDQLAGSFYSNTMAWPISMLIILVPLLYTLEYFIIRDIRQSPEKKDLWIRNWRIFLTLFLTGATIVGDLIALINVYLNGEISSRFILKILVVLIVTGVVFVYYILSKTQNSKIQTVFAWSGIVLVLIAIVSGFIAVGSPNKQRNLKFDNQRVNDLSNIQWQVLNHWQQKGTLPKTLTDLNDSFSGNKMPVDPKTKADYEYSIKVATSSNIGAGAVTNARLSNANPTFELCAVFALPTPDNKGRGDYYGGGGIYPTIAMDSSYGGGYIDGSDNWKHSEGRVCFTRTIDPDKYPTNQKTR